MLVDGLRSRARGVSGQEIGFPMYWLLLLTVGAGGARGCQARRLEGRG